MNKNDSTYCLVWAKKIKAINILGGKCSNCGISDIFVLEFHHDSKDKEFSYSKLRDCRWSKIEKEIKKCILLCGRCHDEYHFGYGKCAIRKKDLCEELDIDSCCKCGYKSDNLSSLHFHHKYGNKLFNIGDYVAGKLNLDISSTELLDEVGKCGVLCSNCHMVDHLDIDRFNNLKDDIYKKIESYKELRAPLDKEKVIRMYESGMKQVEIRKYFGCAKSTICQIIKKERNKTYLGK